MKYILLVFGLLYCTSCATILNSRMTDVDVITTEPSQVIVEQDTFLTHKNKAQLYFKRQKEPVQITVQSDSIRKELTLSPKNSGAYYLNIPYTYGVGMLIERKSPKRWTYDRRVYVDMSNDHPVYYDFFYWRNKGDLYIQAFLPYINSFYLQPEEESTQVKTGFLGIGIGLEYYYKNNRYLALNVQAQTNFPIFVPAPINYSEGGYETLNTSYWSLSHNHRIGRLSLGYGLSYAKNSYRYEASTLEPIPPTEYSRRRVSYSPGFVFPMYYQLGRLFHLGVIYRPSFYRANVDPAYRYEHVISVDFAWKFKYNGF